MTVQPQLTRNQSLVMSALSEAAAPLSAYAILDQLRDDGLKAPLQVYRALDKLLDYGLVHRLESLNAFVACTHPHIHGAGTVAFAICETCGLVSEFADDAVQGRLRSWFRDNDFHPTKTTIEIRGRCGTCRGDDEATDGPDAAV